MQVDRGAHHAGLVAGVGERRHDGRVRHRGDVHAQDLRDRGHARRIQYEQHVEAGRGLTRARRRLDREAAAVGRERQLDEALVHVVLVGHRAGLDEHHAAHGIARRHLHLEGLADVQHGRSGGDRRPRSQRAVGAEQVGRKVQFDVGVDLRARRTAAADHHGGVGQEQCRAVIEPGLDGRRSHGPLPGRRVPDFGAVVDPGHRVVDRAAAGRQHLAIGQYGAGHQAALRRQRRRVCDRRIADAGHRRADVDEGRRVGLTTELDQLARPVHHDRVVDGRGVRAAEGGGHVGDPGRAAGIGGVDGVDHPVRADAEDLAVGPNEVAWVVPADEARHRAERAELAVGAAHFPEVCSTGAARDQGLAIDQRRRAGIPAHPVHGVAGRQGVGRRVEHVGVVVAHVVGGVGHRGVPVVAATEEDFAGRRQHDLGAAEQVGRRGVGQSEVARSEPALRIPDVVDELGRLRAVGIGAVGQHPAVGQQHSVDRDQRPVVDRREHAFDVGVGGDGCRRREGRCILLCGGFGVTCLARRRRGITTAAAGDQQADDEAVQQGAVAKTRKELHGVTPPRRRAGRR